jgi:hypothetical protein
MYERCLQPQGDADHNCADGVIIVRVPKFSSTYQLS